MNPIHCFVNAFVLAGLVLVGGCARPSVATDHPDFLALRGNRYAFQIETYIYEELQDHSPFPVIGFPVIGQAIGSRRFPKNPTEWVGQKYGTIKILAVIPKGTSFTVVQHRVEKNPTIGTLHHVDVRLDGPLGERWPLLDGFYLTPQLSDGIRFHSDVVKRL